MESHPSISADREAPDLDLSLVIDEELPELPEKYRDPLILCYFQGLTYQQAAVRLGCSTATVCRRIADGSELLRARIVRRKLIGAAGLAALLGPQSSAAIPAGLLGRTFVSMVREIGGDSNFSATALNASDEVIRALTLGRSGGVIARCTAVTLAAAATAVAAASGLPVWADALADAEESHIRVPASISDPSDEALPARAISRIGTKRFRTGTRTGSGAIAFVPNSRTMVSAHGDGNIRFWDIDTGTVLEILEDPGHSRSLAIAPDGKRLVAAGSNLLCSWDISNGEARIEWKRHLDSPTSFTVFDRSGNRLAISDALGLGIDILEASNGRTIRSVPTRVGFAKPVFDDAENRLFTCPITGGVQSWNLDDPAAEPRCVVPPEHPICSAVIPAGGQYLVTGSWLDPCVRVWTLDGKEVTSWAASSPTVSLLPINDEHVVAELSSSSIRFRDVRSGAEDRSPVSLSDCLPTGEWTISNYGNSLGIASSGQVAAWDLSTGKQLGPPGQLLSSIDALALSKSGRTLATWTAGRCIDHWQVDGANRLRQEIVPWKVRAYPPTMPFSLRTTEAGWSEDELPGTSLLSSSDSAALCRFPGTRAVVSEDGKSLVRSGVQGVELFDRRSARLVARCDSPFDTTPLGFIDGNRAFIAFTRSTDSIERWSLERGSLTRKTLFAPGPLGQPLVSPDGRILVARSMADNLPMLGVWALSNGTLLASIPVDRGSSPVSCFSLSPDSNRLALGHHDGTVQLVDVGTAAVVLHLAGHEGAIRALAFSGNGARLASSSLDGTAIVWSIRE